MLRNTNRLSMVATTLGLFTMANGILVFKKIDNGGKHRNSPSGNTQCRKKRTRQKGVCEHGNYR